MPLGKACIFQFLCNTVISAVLHQELTYSRCPAIPVGIQINNLISPGPSCQKRHTINISWHNMFFFFLTKFFFYPQYLFYLFCCSKIKDGHIFGVFITYYHSLSCSTLLFLHSSMSDTNTAISPFLIDGFGLRILTEAISVVSLFPILLFLCSLLTSHYHTQSLLLGEYQLSIVFVITSYR